MGREDDMSARREAEAIEQFGDELAAMLKRLDRIVSAPTFDRWNEIEGIEHLDGIAQATRQLGDRLCRECEHAEEAEDRRRDNPLEPDFRRLGQ